MHQLRCLYSLELDRVDRLCVIPDCEFDSKPRRDNQAGINAVMPEASPELVRPFLR
jgi:hypothetical protein